MEVDFVNIFVENKTVPVMIDDRCSLLGFQQYNKSATWPNGSMRRLQMLRGGFGSRLEPIAFEIFSGWLLTHRAQAHFAVSLHYC